MGMWWYDAGLRWSRCVPCPAPREGRPRQRRQTDAVGAQRDEHGVVVRPVRDLRQMQRQLRTSPAADRRTHPPSVPGCAPTAAPAQSPPHCWPSGRLQHITHVHALRCATAEIHADHAAVLVLRRQLHRVHALHTMSREGRAVRAPAPDACGQWRGSAAR